MAPEEVLISPGGGIPVLILDEGIVDSQVHGYGPAALGAAGDQLRRDLHIPLFRHHPADRLLVVIGLLVAGLRALPQAVVPLGIEQPLLVKSPPTGTGGPRCGEDEVVLALYQLQQMVIDRLGGLFIAVHQDLPAPLGPVFLQTLEVVKAAGVHIPDAVFGLEVSKGLPEPLPRSRSSQQRRTGPRPLR